MTNQTGCSNAAMPCSYGLCPAGFKCVADQCCLSDIEIIKSNEKYKFFVTSQL